MCIRDRVPDAGELARRVRIDRREGEGHVTLDSNGYGARRSAAADTLSGSYSTSGAWSPVRELFWIRCREAWTKMMKADGIITRLGIASGGWWMRIP